MIELITGADGTAHVSSADDGALYASIVGTGSYSGKGVGDGLALEIRDNNHLTLGTGCGWHNGRGWRVTSQHDVVVQSGTQAQRRADLVVARYSVEGDREKMEIVTLKGEPVADSAQPEYPAHEEGSVLGGARVSDMPLYGVKLNGLNIEGTEKLFSEVPSLSDLLGLIQAANKSIGDLKKAVDGKAAANHGHAAATQGADGFMSGADKKKLDGVAAGANNYSLPTGSGGTKGGVTLSDSTSSASNASGGVAATPAAVKAVRDSLSRLPSFVCGQKVVTLNPDRTVNIMSFKELSSAVGFAVDRNHCAMLATSADYAAHPGGFTSFASADSIGVVSEGSGQTARVNYAIACWR